MSPNNRHTLYIAFMFLLAALYVVLVVRLWTYAICSADRCEKTAHMVLTK